MGWCLMSGYVGGEWVVLGNIIRMTSVSDGVCF